ncbi:YbjQ family protein [Vibrio sp. WXL210]|uniref:YbjQ family protein n=1 Tax=Vibrio sp. WXL210 TaxID=3450709 RepID=UPI003EC69AAC
MAVFVILQKDNFYGAVDQYDYTKGERSVEHGNHDDVGIKIAQGFVEVTREGGMFVGDAETALKNFFKREGITNALNMWDYVDPRQGEIEAERKAKADAEQARKDQIKNMMTLNTGLPMGIEVEKIGGVVTVSTVEGVNIFRDALASVRDLVGGKSQTLMKGLEKSKQEALDELKVRAYDLGCDALIGVVFDVETMSGTNAATNMTAITVTATAVKIK